MSDTSTTVFAVPYAQAVRQIDAMIDQERPIISQWGASRLLTHGHPVENALVLFHGFTNCPQQFAALGARFYDLGYNVFIPRLPQHGLADRLTGELAQLSVHDLYDLGNRATDLAHGLGQRVIVAGLSLSGLITTWLALHRTDVDLAVSIAPDLGVLSLPTWLDFPLSTLAHVLPNFYIWWDPRTKAANPESYPFAYPGFPSRAAGVLIAMARDVRTQALTGKPVAKKVLFVSIGGDPAVNNREIERVARVWQQRAPGVVTTYEFDRSYHFPHDIITPESPRTRIDVVYPKLIELIASQVNK